MRVLAEGLDVEKAPGIKRRTSRKMAVQRVRHHRQPPDEGLLVEAYVRSNDTKGMMEELSSVRLKKSIPNREIAVGTRGAIVMIHQTNPPVYEVEFFDDQGNTLEDSKTGEFTFTLEEEYIEIVGS